MQQDYEATRRTAIEHAIKVYGIPEEKIPAFQSLCIHPTWVEVGNIPLDVCQYEQNDYDWVCLVCGKLIPPFPV